MDRSAGEPGGAGTRQCPYCYEWIHADAVKCRYCRSTFGPGQPDPKRCARRQDRILLGVCSGLAARYGIPASAVRLGFVLLSLFHGFGILLYLLLWAISPDRADRESRAHGWIGAIGRIWEAVKKAARAEFPSGKPGPGSGPEADRGRGHDLAESR